jgi:type I restriction enzyme S subunit
MSIEVCILGISIYATVTTAKAGVDALVPVAGQTFTLTTGADSFALTNGDDTVNGTFSTLIVNDRIIDNITTDKDVLNVDLLGGTVPPTVEIKNVETLNGIYPIYGSGGVIGRANQYLCIAGSTIIGRKGTINNPIFVEEHFWNVDTAFGLKANDAILDKYLYYFCLSFDFSKLDKSTAMPSLTKTSIGNVLIPIPPYKEQERIVAKIDMVLDTMNEILRAV